MKITTNASLKNRNSLALPGHCHRLIEIEKRNDFNYLQDIVKADDNVWVLGGGTNTVITQTQIPHTIITQYTPASVAKGIVADGGHYIVEASLPWPALVCWSVSQGLGGIENLAAIPGSCGAAPVQNIGAYGAEIKDVLAWVEVFDWKAGSFLTLDNAACRFGYRDSLFKQSPEAPWIITRIALRLRRNAPLRIDYAGVRETLQQQGVDPENASYAQVASAITALRARKLPDPNTLPNAGSFFKNPLVSTDQLQSLKNRFPGLPHWTHLPDKHKVSAAWLIEHLGLRSYRVGDAGFYQKHALIMVNHGRATGADILALMKKVRNQVAAVTGITLEPEPVFLPAAD